MNLKTALVGFTILLSFSSFALEDCPPVTEVPARELIQTLSSVTDNLFRDIISLKVNLDGQGKIEVFLVKGEPKILRMNYSNGKGQFVEQVSFDDLAKGIPLSYENKDKKGKAIVLERSESFKNGKTYHFKLLIRTGVNPDEYSSFPLELDASSSNPKVSVKDKNVTRITLTPRVSFLSWDGTFKKVDFN
jgi:hypothetical protein